MRGLSLEIRLSRELFLPEKYSANEGETDARAASIRARRSLKLDAVLHPRHERRWAGGEVGITGSVSDNSR
jgi:hypothetical protein